MRAWDAMPGGLRGSSVGVGVGCLLPRGVAPSGCLGGYDEVVWGPSVVTGVVSMSL